MEAAFYVAGAVAVISTLLTITRLNPMHALLYLVLSLLAVAVVFFTFGAPFIAALEVIVYAGAIMVLFLFVVMMLNLGEQTMSRERAWLTPGIWVGPGILSAVLLAEVVYLLSRSDIQQTAGQLITPKQVGIALFGPYVLGVELASILLLGGLVGAFHLGVRRQSTIPEGKHGVHSHDSRPAPGGDLVHAGDDRPARQA